MDDPYLNKLAATVRHIYHATTKGELNWAPSDSRPDEMETYIAGRRVTIGSVDYLDEEGDEITDVEISIYDPDGRKLESIRDTNFVGIGLGIAGFSGWYALMNSILTSARRRVDGSEKAIDDILSALVGETLD